MTGVGDEPKDFGGFITSTKKRLLALEGRQSVPARLTSQGQQVTDWNDALEDGFYWSATGALNTPFDGDWVGYVQNHAGAGRTTQRLSQPFGNPTGNVELVRIHTTAGWFGWRRADGRYIEVTVSGSTRVPAIGRYDLNAGANSWFFQSVFQQNNSFKSWRITFETRSSSLHRPLLRFLSTGTTQINSADYALDLWDTTTGHTATTTATAFELAKADAFAHAGEFILNNPAVSSQTDNPKAISGKTYSFPGAQTLFGGALDNYDTTAMNGFVLYLSGSQVIGASTGSFITIQGLA